MHKTAQMLRILGIEKAGADVVKLVEEANTFGIILLVVISTTVVRQMIAMMYSKSTISLTMLIMKRQELALTFLLVLNIILLT